ncbi:hypothetical protein EVAR_51365_1 [Eumeta japonica]|uniref:Uncharacterized protein n=1 Tax=Eumeta variegata TaxID=151549 RepID=A0A4C1Y735_EUMVA|nr:hypothetical protein EVAR_51365_1 [Eumeta japonica]
MENITVNGITRNNLESSGTRTEVDNKIAQYQRLTLYPRLHLPVLTCNEFLPLIDVAVILNPNQTLNSDLGTALDSDINHYHDSKPCPTSDYNPEPILLLHIAIYALRAEAFC